MARAKSLMLKFVETARGRGWCSMFAEHGDEHQNRGDRDYFRCGDDGLNPGALPDSEKVHD